MLVGDIGGTKVRLALVEGKRIVKEEKFLAQEFASFDAALNKFLKEPVQEACLAVAGPVKEGRCRMTNLPWVLEEKALEKKHQIKAVHLMNDLEAAGWGLKVLKSEDLVVLNRGENVQGHKAVVSAGTGLGMVGLYWDGKEHHPMPSEGGHVDWAAMSDEEGKFWKLLHKEYGHVSAERVVSGPGLHTLEKFLKRPERALEWFTRFYGQIAGNVALQWLPTGGLYLAGGMAPAILPHLQKGPFMESFVSKGRFKNLLLKIPVYVVVNEKLPLLGAWQYHLRR